MTDAVRAELDRMVKLLPQEPSDEIPGILRSRGFLSKDALVYRIGYYADPLDDLRKKKAVLVKCSACGEETYLEYEKIESGCWRGGCSDGYGFRDVLNGKLIKSGENTVCPYCHRRVMAVGAAQIGKGMSYRIDHDFALTVHNVGGHLTLLGWRISKNVTKDAKIVYGCERMQGAAAIGRTMVRFAGCQHGYHNAVTFYSRWKPRYTYNDDKITDFDRMHIFVDSPQTVGATDSANSALDKYVDTKYCSYPTMYLEAWCKYPQIENLVMQGCQHIVTAMIEQCTHVGGNWIEKTRFKAQEMTKYITPGEVKPHRMLGIDKEDMWVAREFDLRMLRFYKDVKQKYGISLNSRLLQAARKAVPEYLDELFYLYKAPVVRTINYIEKQQAKNTGIKINAQYLKDYWEHLQLIYGEIAPSVQYPSDLRRAHDEKVKLYSAAKDPIINAGIIRRAEQLAALVFEDAERGLLIRPCADQGELIVEGKTLDHCVAKYGGDIAKGKTSIFFIRKTDAPDVPYCTLEYKNNGINQNRAYDNQDPPPEVTVFANEWLKWANKIVEQTKIKVV